MSCKNPAINRALKLGLFGFLCFFMLIAPAMALPSGAGTHYSEAIEDIQGDVSGTGIIGYISSFFDNFLSIGARTASGDYIGTFQTNQEVYVEADAVAYNKDCSSAYFAIELYKDNVFKSAKSTRIGAITGINPATWFEKNFYYKSIASFGLLPEGNYEAVGYIACSDFGTDTIISAIQGGAPFIVNDPSSTEAIPEGWVGIEVCRATSTGHEDVYRLWQNSDGTSSFKMTRVCSSTETCKTASCRTMDICGDGRCTGDESYASCPDDNCSDPTKTSYSWIAWLIGGLVAFYLLWKFVIKKFI